MSEVDGWSALGARFGEQTLQAFGEFAEQIELVLQLLESGGRSRNRTALTELHSLADILLYRHAHLVFRAVEGGTYWHHAQQFTQPERRQIERSFTRRIDLATRAIDGLFVDRIEPLLDESDAEIFRIAHSYRNPAYHRGEQNMTTLPLIARVFLAALLRAWCRSQPRIGFERRSWAAAKLERVAEADLGSDFVRLDHAAEHIAEGLTSRASPGPSEVREVLAADLVARAQAVETLLEDLEREGFDRGRAERGLAWSEAGSQLEREPESVDLERRRRELASELVVAAEAGKRPKRLYDRYAEVQESIASRFFSTVAGYRSRSSLRTVEQLPKRIAAMRRLKREAAVLRRYREIDADLEPVERGLWEMALGWEAEMEMENDRYREERSS